MAPSTCFEDWNVVSQGQQEMEDEKEKEMENERQKEQNKIDEKGSGALRNKKNTRKLTK